jgi:hypothetical protein
VLVWTFWWERKFSSTETRNPECSVHSVVAVRCTGYILQAIKKKIYIYIYIYLVINSVARQYWHYMTDSNCRFAATSYSYSCAFFCTTKYHSVTVLICSTFTCVLSLCVCQRLLADVMRDVHSLCLSLSVSQKPEDAKRHSIGCAIFTSLVPKAYSCVEFGPYQSTYYFFRFLSSLINQKKKGPWINAINFVFLLRYPFPLQKRSAESLGRNFSICG